MLSLARQLFHQRPALFGTLIYIFQSLDDEYDDVQGVPTTRYNHIVQQLTQPLLEALDANSTLPRGCWRSSTRFTQLFSISEHGAAIWPGR